MIIRTKKKMLMMIVLIMIIIIVITIIMITSVNQAISRSVSQSISPVSKFGELKMLTKIRLCSELLKCSGVRQTINLVALAVLSLHEDSNYPEQSVQHMAEQN